MAVFHLTWSPPLCNLTSIYTIYRFRRVEAKEFWVKIGNTPDRITHYQSPGDEAVNTLVNIKALPKIKEDDRGATYALNTKTSGKFIYLTRRAGSLSGNSYHTGKQAATHPKVIILLEGKIEFCYRKIGMNEVNREIITGPAQIEIQPYVTHNVMAITDIIFLEAASYEELSEDRVFEAVE